MRKLYKKLKHIVEYILFMLFMKSLRLLGIDNSASLCGFLARNIGSYLNPTKIAKKNLEKALGKDINMSDMINDLWDNFGRSIGEFPFTDTLNNDELAKRVEIIGIENIENYKKLNIPVVIVAAHLANWEIALAAFVQMYHKVAAVYRKQNNPLVNTEIIKIKKRQSIKMIPKGKDGIRQLISVIKSKYNIAMLIDQKINEGIEVPFFGMPAMTSHQVAKLNLQHGYPIIPIQTIRKSGTSYFKLIIHPAIDVKKTDNPKEDIYNITAEINQVIERWIRENPTQWFWFHNRWKG